MLGHILLNIVMWLCEHSFTSFFKKNFRRSSRMSWIGLGQVLQNQEVQQLQFFLVIRKTQQQYQRRIYPIYTMINTMGLQNKIHQLAFQVCRIQVRRVRVYFLLVNCQVLHVCFVSSSCWQTWHSFYMVFYSFLYYSYLYATTCRFSKQSKEFGGCIREQ